MTQDTSKDTELHFESEDFIWTMELLELHVSKGIIGNPALSRPPLSTQIEFVSLFRES